jgi:hypothetical protein
MVYRYAAQGNNATASLNYESSAVPAVWLPVAATNTHSALAANHMPVFTSPTISPYMQQMPSDFGLAPYYVSNTISLQDTFVVSSGTEEWEIIAFTSNASTDAGRILFCARTV